MYYYFSKADQSFAHSNPYHQEELEADHIVVEADENLASHAPYLKLVGGEIIPMSDAEIEPLRFAKLQNEARYLISSEADRTLSQKEIAVNKSDEQGAESSGNKTLTVSLNQKKRTEVAFHLLSGILLDGNATINLCDEKGCETTLDKDQQKTFFADYYSEYAKVKQLEKTQLQLLAKATTSTQIVDLLSNNGIIEDSEVERYKKM